jgi:hypothetical protein
LSGDFGVADDTEVKLFDENSDTTGNGDCDFGNDAFEDKNTIFCLFSEIN